GIASSPSTSLRVPRNDRRAVRLYDDTLQLTGCPTIMDGKNLTPQNAPGSTIGNLGGVLLPPRMPIFAFIGQPPYRRVFHLTQV
ncbi:MAG TPA: hypothetical protein VI935_10285, partial [Thermodesulfobacteriota bacterium]|nr:hypothetical protein [Thermodesulfobacteriota bacterium]